MLSTIVVAGILAAKAVAKEDHLVSRRHFKRFLDENGNYNICASLSTGARVTRSHIDTKLFTTSTTYMPTWISFKPRAPTALHQRRAVMAAMRE